MLAHGAGSHDSRLYHIRTKQKSYMDALKITEVVHNIVVTIAAVVAGIWAWNRLKRERTDEAAIEMALSTTSTDVGGDHLVFFPVQLANKGKTKIEAKSARDANGWVFDDGPEKLRYPCSLQIRRINAAKGAQPQSLDWFEGGPWQDMRVFRNEMEINVLLEYQNPKAGEKIEFWMEPGEIYRLGVPVLLPAAAYIAKLTFVAADQPEDWLDRQCRELGICNGPSRQPDENFWSQIYGFNVPVPKA